MSLLSQEYLRFYLLMRLSKVCGLGGMEFSFGSVLCHGNPLELTNSQPGISQIIDLQLEQGQLLSAFLFPMHFHTYVHFINTFYKMYLACIGLSTPLNNSVDQIMHF